MDSFSGYASMALAWFLKNVARLPLRILYGVSDFLYFLAYKVIGYRKKVVERNLKTAFPYLSDSERKQIEKRFYHHLCDVIVESFKLLHISDKELDRRIIVEGAELVDRNVENGKSTILFLGHYGNWEWVPAITHHFKEKQVFAQIYSSLHNSVVKDTMHIIRSRFGAENIEKNKAYRRLVEIKQRGDNFVTGFIADQRPLGKNLHHWTKFLGVDTAYMAGGETIGERLDAEYLYLDIVKTSRGHYKLSFKELEPCDDGKGFPVTRAFMNMLEKTIRREPAYWLWSHNRWKANKIGFDD